MTNPADITPASHNRKTVFIASSVAFAMLMLGFASKPLYDTFCRVTGYGGTTVIAEQASTIKLDRQMTVRFDSNVAPGLTWEFVPEQRQVTIAVGENTLAFYNVTNYGRDAIVGTASYNVMPVKAAPYFAKLQCFCFTQQRIEPGQSVRMPVLFYIHPEIAEEQRLDDVHSITLSYTFHKVANPGEDALTQADRDKIMTEVETLDLTQ